MKILVPVDFSGNSGHAAEQAILWAEDSGSELKFCYVSHVLTPTGSITYGVPVETQAEHLESRENDLKKMIEPLLEKHKVSNRVKYSYIAVNNAVNSDGIIQLANEWNADMIVMGNKGESNVATKIFGSTTTSVLDKSEIPVCTIPTGSLRSNWKKIGIGTDLITVERDIVKNANVLGKLSVDFDLIYVHPVFPEKVSIDSFSPEKLCAELHNQTGFAFHWTPIKTEKENDISGGIDSYIEEKDPDVLIMFYTRRNWFEKLIDTSMTKSMILSNKVAVLSIKRNPKIA